MHAHEPTGKKLSNITDINTLRWQQYQQYSTSNPLIMAESPPTVIGTYWGMDDCPMVHFMGHSPIARPSLKNNIGNIRQTLAELPMSKIDHQIIVLSDIFSAQKFFAPLQVSNYTHSGGVATPKVNNTGTSESDAFKYLDIMCYPAIACIPSDW